MKGTTFQSGLVAILLTSSMLLPVSAQVTSDGTTNTTVNVNGNNFTIINGIQRGDNLFHSFGEFSIPTGGSAVFNNSVKVENIINRVTGGSISNIDGLIKANGNANLFLINPNGIVFGENAKLDIGGSFLGSTAESILFGDGFEFSAVNSQSEPLLTVTVPVGLQMGSSSGDITVNGKGHQLTGGTLNPVIRNNTLGTLQVNSGHSITLVGQNINLNGGVLTAENGRIELGGVKTGVVNLDTTYSNFQLNFDNIESFGDIQLLNQSLVDASGITSSGIQLQAENIALKDGSVSLIQNMGNDIPANIQVSAKGNLELSGDARIAADAGNIKGSISSGVMTEILGMGNSADINVDAGDLKLDSGGIILSKTFSPAMGGNINVNVAGDIHLNGSAALNPASTSGIATSTFSPGKSGSIDVSASNLTLTNGSIINTLNNRQGNSGNLDINVLGKIEVRGIEPRTVSSSNIGSTVFGEGNSGIVNINTSRLIVEDGASVTTSTLNSGNGGKITINASESIEVRGSSPNGELFSRISASALIFPPVFRQIFGLPDIPSGNAGSVNINTPRLQVDSKGEIAVNNPGVGNAGNLIINTNSLKVDNQGKLIADTKSGEGGNIFLNIESDLILRNNSLIDTEALGAGNGGNITINSPIITGLENSNIIANAVEGNGGNINIKTQGIFGLKFSEQLTEESDITASSEFGINGQVMLQQLDFNPVASLIELPSNFESTTQVKAGCRNSAVTKFLISGKDNLQQQPSDLFNGSKILVSLVDLISERNTQSNISSQNNRVNHYNQTNSIMEATGLIRNKNGEIQLIASGSESWKNRQVTNCSS